MSADLRESYPLPALAQTAATLVLAAMRRDLGVIGDQTIAVMGLSADPTWVVDFDAGTVSRPMPVAAPSDHAEP